MDQALLVTLSAVAGVVVVGLLVGLVVTLVAGARGRRRLEAELAAARADVAGLRSQVDDLARTVPPPPPADHAAPGREYVITSISDQAAGTELAVPATTELTGLGFVSVAAGESLVRVVSLAHGVRRALSAENRNRIRFEVRREVKRSRRQRRRDLKDARRQLRSQARTDLSEDAA
jgi:hypothetical protein